MLQQNTLMSLFFFEVIIGVFQLLLIHQCRIADIL